MWRQQHVVGHHAYTNLDGVDPDIRTTATDVRSVTPHHSWHPYHVRWLPAWHMATCNQASTSFVMFWQRLRWRLRAWIQH